MVAADLIVRMQRACYAKAGEIGLTKPEIRELAMNAMGCSINSASIASLRILLAELDGFVNISALLALRPSTQAILEAQRRRLRGG